MKETSTIERKQFSYLRAHSNRKKNSRHTSCVNLYICLFSQYSKGQWVNAISTEGIERHLLRLELEIIFYI